jgi:hypothetical protein
LATRQCVTQCAFFTSRKVLTMTTYSILDTTFLLSHDQLVKSLEKTYDARIYIYDAVSFETKHHTYPRFIKYEHFIKLLKSENHLPS